MKHNFNEVTFGFATIDGKEIKGIDCSVGFKGCSVANVCNGPMFGNDDQMHEQRRQNARRIAACINYCKDMTTEELEA